MNTNILLIKENYLTIITEVFFSWHCQKAMLNLLQKHCILCEAVSKDLTSDRVI